MILFTLQLAWRNLSKDSYADQAVVGKRWHRYFWQDLDHRFILEAAPDQSLYYMTTQKGGVMSGDYIEISGLEGSSRYQIIKLEHYSDPADMWMATLQKISKTLSQL